MKEGLLPSISHDYDRTQREGITKYIRRFTTFNWLTIQEKHPDKDLPAGVITVGPNFVGHGKITRFHEGKEIPREVEGATLAFDKAIVTRDFTVGQISMGRTIDALFEHLNNSGKLEPAYVLFVADEAEWQRIIGNHEVVLRQDNYLIIRYSFGDQSVEVRIFNDLQPVVQESVSANGLVTASFTENLC